MASETKAEGNEVGFGELKYVTCPHKEGGGSHRMAYHDYAPASGQTDSTETVLCVHGLTRNSSDFAKLANVLAAAEYRVICVDVVGRGASDYVDDGKLYAPETYCADLIVLVKELGLKKVHWVGTSMGGLLGMFVAATPKEALGFEIDVFVINDSAPFLAATALERIGSYVGELVLFDDLDAAEAEFRKRYAPFGPLTDEDWKFLTKNSVVPNEPGVEGSKLRPAYDVRIGERFKTDGPAKDVDLWPFFAQMKLHALLLLHGEKSDLVSEETAARMVEPKECVGITGARMVADIEGIGHAPHIQDEFQINLVRQFIDNERSSAASK